MYRLEADGAIWLGAFCGAAVCGGVFGGVDPLPWKIAGGQAGKHFAFGVSEDPLLMKETSPYGDIKVRHLEDHDFQPERVDFVITRLPNGNSRLEGTTTDQNKMWPGAYWRIWTDGLIHSIHRRVFEYIKQLAEADAGRTAVRQ